MKSTESLLQSTTALLTSLVTSSKYVVSTCTLGVQGQIFQPRVPFLCSFRDRNCTPETTSSFWENMPKNVEKLVVNKIFSDYY